MNDLFSEKLTYLLNYLEGCIASAAHNVLTDKEDDPQYSAVTTSNLIKCYIDIKRMLGEQPEYSSVEEYLRFNCFTSAELQDFERKRLRESTYYTGKQY